MAGQQGEIRVSQTNESVAALCDLWTRHFASAMQTMSGEQPALEVRPGSAEASDELLWWHQSLDAAPGSSLWIGTPIEICTMMGTRILAAAGIPASESNEARETYLEVVRQSLGSFVEALGAKLGREILCLAGRDEAPTRGLPAGCEIFVRRTGKQLPPLVFLVNREMLDVISIPTPAAPVEDERTSVTSTAEPEPELSTRAASTLDLLMDVEMPVSVSFGRTRVRVQEILKLITGSIVELDRSITEPVEVIVNNCVVARGEVVVIEGNYGVRITEVMSRSERLQESHRSLLSMGRTASSLAGRSWMNRSPGDRRQSGGDRRQYPRRTVADD
ncbi:MAG TPA: flagellar motor switch protein FliN [Bryobacteraceae bacterium]|nr:flagellar motor switch protein FliN [Bryobacteraceae bacterium]